jgi:hypothetical protein
MGRDFANARIRFTRTFGAIAISIRELWKRGLVEAFTARTRTINADQ